MNNVELSELLKAVAAAYELQEGKNTRFKIIAYERAADAVQHLSTEAKDLWDDGKLQSVSGIGPSIAQHLSEIFEKGESEHFKQVFADTPKAVFELIKVSGIGPKSAFRFSKELKISDQQPINDLLKKAKNGKIAEMDGFGEDSQQAIIEGIKELEGRETRMLLSYAKASAEPLLEWLEKDENVIRADALGSLRRRASTIGDIDLSASTKDPRKTLEHFTKYPKSNRTLEKGERSSSIILPGNIQVDLKVQRPDSYGSLLQHFTGSKHHNIALREYANKKGVSLSEYGIKVKSNKKSKSLKLKDKNLNKEKNIYEYSKEEDFYNALGMKWIQPELREDSGEIQASLNGELPDLIVPEDIKGDLQIHSDFDIETSHDVGDSSMEQIIKKAEQLGYEYIAFTEHNPSKSGHNKTEIVELLKKKKEKVSELNQKLKQNNKSLKRVFNSLEIDILPDGRLPVPDEGLELLDFALVSIHSSFRQSRKKMTNRILQGISHPKVKIWAHPTGRKINEREGVEVDWDQILDYFQEKNKLFEINADPMRLDLPAVNVKDGVDSDILFTTGTDAHHVDAMDNMIFAVYVARRGWAEKDNILTSYDLETVEKVLL